jgi:hypothetical protein
MSYDTSGLRMTYTFAGISNAATAAALAAIRVPAGVRFAAIEDISIAPSVATSLTTPGTFQIGTAASSGKYAAQNVGTAAGLAPGLAYGTADLDGRVAAYNPAVTPSAANKGRIDLMQDGDAAGTLLTSLKVGNTAAGATALGTYTAFVTIRWW